MGYVPVNWEEGLRRECSRRRLSPRTYKTYHYCISRFLAFADKELGKIGKKDVREFLDKMADKGLSGNSLNTYHMALRFLFGEVLDKRMWIDIKYSKTPEKLPLVLSKEEVKKIFSAISNPKHLLMTELMYSAGLRVSELLNLRVCDLEIGKGYGFVRGGKGGKDRLFILSEKVIGRIKDLIDNEHLNSDGLLFMSNRGERYSVRSVQQILKNASKVAGIDKKVHPHTLRHSFATHLIENGYDVSNVQALLGHKSPETTMVYVHAATKNMLNIKSPIEDL